jgi:hypothetical protein
VFHASLLKKAITPNIEPQPLPACMNEDWHLEPGPEKVLEQRWNAQGEVEVLVKWEGLPEFENSWEHMEKFRKEFPGFLLKDKEIFEGGGIDSFERIYKRKQGNNNVENQNNNAEDQNNNAEDQNNNEENQNHN